MSKSVKLGCVLYLLWLAGFALLSVTKHPVAEDWRQLYFWLPIWGPLALIALLSALLWLTGKRDI